MRYELSDYEWSVIRPMLPNKPRGIPVSTTGAFSTASSGSCDQVRHGAICRRASALNDLIQLKFKPNKCRVEVCLAGRQKWLRLVQWRPTPYAY